MRRDLPQCQQRVALSDKFKRHGWFAFTRILQLSANNTNQARYLELVIFVGRTRIHAAVSRPACCRSRYSASIFQNNPRQICRILPPLLPRFVSLDNYANIPCVLAMAAIDPDLPDGFIIVDGDFLIRKLPVTVI